MEIILRNNYRKQTLTFLLFPVLMFFVNVKVGYMRVSTSDGRQKFDMQETALLKSGVAPEKIYKDMESGAKIDRIEFNYMLKSLNPGDTVVVWNLDRLGRDFNQMMETIDDLRKRDIKIESLTDFRGIDVNPNTASGRFFFRVVAARAQWEREIIIERINSGLAEAKRRGMHLGRRFKFNEYDKQTIQHMIKANVPKKEIAQRFNVTVRTLFNYFTPEGEIKQRG